MSGLGLAPAIALSCVWHNPSPAGTAPGVGGLGGAWGGALCCQRLCEHTGFLRVCVCAWGFMWEWVCFFLGGDNIRVVTPVSVGMPQNRGVVGAETPQKW